MVGLFVGLCDLFGLFGWLVCLLVCVICLFGWLVGCLLFVVVGGASVLLVIGTHKLDCTTSCSH